MIDNELDRLAPRSARSSAWIGRAVFEAGLIVLGLVGALVVDEWRDTREREARVRAALTSIRAELDANTKAVSQALTNHLDVIARLRMWTEAGRVYQGGIISGAPFSAVAWEAARDGGITNDIEYAQLTTIGYAYNSLEQYLNGRELFSNYLYTSDVTELRQNPEGLAGWLSDLSRHARSVRDRLVAAHAALADGSDPQDD